jgi:outer membrane protein assembly factor BamD (BamD/ComL family)
MLQERMIRMTTRLMLSALCCIFLLSCSGDKAKELLETAQFEERQMNLPHAKQLYEDVIRLYPTSKEAATAQTRLATLKQTP